MSADVACPHHDVVNSANTRTDIEYTDTNTKTCEFNKMQGVTDKHEKGQRPFSASEIGYAKKHVIIRPFSDTEVRLRDIREPDSSDVDGKLSTLRTKIVNNWIFIKENSSPFSWWKQLKAKFFSKSDSKETFIESMKIDRKDVTELLLIKMLKKGVCRNVDDVAFLESTIFGETKHILKREEKKNIQKASSDINNDDSTNLTKHRTEWERCLNRRDLISIKDHLLQEDKITFEENEMLVKDDNYYSRNKTHLFSQMLQTVEWKTDKGSIQCFIKYATHIMEEKHCGQHEKQMIKSQPVEMIQPANRSSKIYEGSFIEYDNKKGQNGPFTLEIKLVNKKNDTEVPEIYQQAKDNANATEMIMAQVLGADCIDIIPGSLLITFQPFQRDMYCTSDFRFRDTIKMLLKEMNLESWLATGEYKLTAKVSVNEPVNQKAHEFLPLPDSINFVNAEKSFLEDEIDTVAVLDALEKRQIKIENSDQPHDRKTIASKLLKAIIDNDLGEDFISILRENGMMYVLTRYEAFQKVFRQETDGLRRKIIRQFSTITKIVKVVDVREILIGLGIIHIKKLNGIVLKCGNREDIAMSTLIIECLKSSYAIHAFAYALHLLELNPLDEMILSERQQISDANHKNGNYHNQEGTNLLFEGSFNIIINDVDEEKGIVQGLVELGKNSGKEICNVVNASRIDINGDASFTSKHDKSTHVVSKSPVQETFFTRILDTTVV